MKYYLIAGEASGDLHASNLMKALKEADNQAEFRFWGGELMQSVGGTLVKHYKETAFMGFIPVLLHLPDIIRHLRLCKKDLLDWRPDVVILVDYPGFNLKIAEFAKRNGIRTFYYISPKIWAWKEGRIKNIKRDIDEMFSILPFEVDFYNRHHYPIHYVGNPCVDAVNTFRTDYKQDFQQFCQENHLEDKPMIALLAGSRKQEIKDNLAPMIEAVKSFPDYQAVIAAAPGIDRDYYLPYIKEGVKVVFGQTYALLSHATAALVTSGTATLETALFDVPQVVCYYTPLGKLIAFLKKYFLKVQYISLVNLIAGKEVVTELVADKMTVINMRKELTEILPEGNKRDKQLSEYKRLQKQLGQENASQRAAKKMVELLKR